MYAYSAYMDKITRIHKKIHSGDFSPKPEKKGKFACFACGKAFGSREAVTHHEQAAHKKKLEKLIKAQHNDG